MKNYDNIRISVIMPCRDEEGTVGSCVDEARSFLEEYDPAGEVIVVDNCSTDNSAALALDHGARLIEESRIGYGYAIRCGLFEAAGSVIFIIDCDMTYDVADMENMLKLIDDGYDMVIGDRLSGVIEKGAMPLVHRIGVRILSKLAAARFHVEVNDFHCGIRALSRAALSKLDLKCGGMEFATEMIAEASNAGLRIAQIPVRLRKCSAVRSSKLRVIRDGFRHLIYIIAGHIPGQDAN